MTKEQTIGEARNTYVKSWSEIVGRLPENPDPEAVSFLRHYFRAQLRIADGKTTKAGRIFSSLLKRPGYDKFEEKNQSVLAAIDLVVKGSTRWDVKEPKFEIVEWRNSNLSG